MPMDQCPGVSCAINAVFQEVDVSLHGSLETFPLAEVIGLLAGTRKTGSLSVDGSPSRGRLWFSEGQVVATEASGPSGPTSDDVDAVFELLRLDGGSFRFDADEKTARAGRPVAAERLLADAAARLEEWRAIEAVIPSLRHRLGLVAEAPTPEVILSAARWRTMVAVAAAGTGSGVADLLSVSSLDACRAVRDLVESGLVEVGEPVEAAGDETPLLAFEAPEAAIPPVIEAAAEDTDPVREAIVEPRLTTAAAEAVAPMSDSVAVASADADDADRRAAELSDWRSWGDDTWQATPEAAPAEKDPWAEYTTPGADPASAASAGTVSVAMAADAGQGTVAVAVAIPVGEGDEDEEINRGLLLKFLSSVRS